MPEKITFQQVEKCSEITSAVPLAGVHKVDVATLRVHRRFSQNGSRAGDGGADVVEQSSALGRPDDPYFWELSSMVARQIEVPGEAPEGMFLPKTESSRCMAS